MTKEQLLNKWRDKAIDAARHDDWIKPCYQEDLERGVDPDDLVLHGREQWTHTDHFQVLYGSKMHNDALDFLIARGDQNTEAIFELKQDLIDAFWEAWEDELGAYDLVASAKLQWLAGKMFDLLEVKTSPDNRSFVYFTCQARFHASPEFLALWHWYTDRNHAGQFLLNHAYDLLDYVMNDDVELRDIELNIPEADIYTKDLFAWLTGSVNNLHYITEALDLHPADAFGLLQRAQSLAIRDIWSSLIQVLKDCLQ